MKRPVLALALLLWPVLLSAQDAPQTAPANGTAPAGFTDKELRRAERRERRRLRRERRRQLREEGRDAEAAALGPDEETEERTEEAVEQGMETAGKKAGKLGDILKKTLNGDAGDMPAGKSLAAALTGSGIGGGSGGGSAGGGGGSGGDAPVSAKESKVGSSLSLPNPSNPKSVDDLLASARSGYGGAFDSLGLKVGQGSDGKPAIVGGDGSPATTQQLDQLSQTIANEPTILEKRPDFFKVLPRERFQDLKKDVRNEDIGEEIFKDVAMTSRDRDFIWSRNCGGVSGGCNNYARQTSYRKDDYVQPEDLGSLWKAAHEEAGAQSGAAPVASAAVNAKGIRSRLNVVLQGIKAAFQDTTSKSGGAGATPGASSVSGVFAGSFSWGGGKSPEVTFSETPKKQGAGADVSMASPISPAGVPAEKRPAAGMALGLAVAGLFGLVARRLTRSS